MKTAAVIVAAGMSSRMKAFKPMLPLAGSTVIRTAIGTLRSVGVSQIVVVTGRNAEELALHVASPDVVCIHNERYESTDMFFSARMGLREAQDKAELVFFLPADSPLFSRESLLALLERMERGGCDILTPTYNGLCGHPLLLRSRAIPTLLGYTGEGGLRGAAEAFPGKRELLELPDLGLTLDADRPEDYVRLCDYAKSVSLT